MEGDWKEGERGKGVRVRKGTRVGDRRAGYANLDPTRAYSN